MQKQCSEAANTAQFINYKSTTTLLLVGVFVSGAEPSQYEARRHGGVAE